MTRVRLPHALRGLKPVPRHGGENVVPSYRCGVAGSVCPASPDAHGLVTRRDSYPRPAWLDSHVRDSSAFARPEDVLMPLDILETVVPQGFFYRVALRGDDGDDPVRSQAGRQPGTVATHCSVGAEESMKAVTMSKDPMIGKRAKEWTS